LLDYAAASSRYRNIGTIQREDSLDSYKCVPLDPDKNIEDGKIRVNADTGELLTDVVKEREIVRAADSTKGGMEPGRLEKYLGTALGVILAVILFGSIGYFVYTLFISTGSSKVLPISGAAAAAAAAATVAPGPPTEESWVQKIPMYGLLTLIAGFIGFIIGAMLS
jgi:hypothetical protein